MVKLEEILQQWQDVRDGLIREVDLIPADRLGFQATSDTRSILEVLQHIVETEKVIVGELCREDTNFRRQPFPALIAEYAGEVKKADTKDAIVELSRSSMEETKQTVRQFGEEKLEKLTSRFDGKQTPKLAMINFVVGHEMYHRGQVTVYQRLLGIEPELTRQFRKLFSK